MRRGRAVAAAAALLTALAPVVVVPAPGGAAAAASGPSPAAEPAARLDGCGNVTTAGRYVLSGNVTNGTSPACVRIEASDVVLDGRGHALDGTDAPDSVGIRVVGSAEASNVTVRNLAVSDWDHGIRFENVTGGAVSAIAARSNEHGIDVDGSSRVAVRNSTLASNGGTGVSVGRHYRVTEDGDVRFFRSHNVTVRSNVLRSNGVGIEVYAANGTVANNTVTDSRGWGIYLDGADDNAVRNNTVTGGDGHGIKVYSGSDDNAITDNLVSGNGGYGVDLTGVHTRAIADNTVADNTVRSNALGGLDVDGGPNITVARNAVEGNDGSGIEVSGDHNRFVGNAITGNSGPGVRVDGSDHGVYLNNTLARNGGAGVALVGHGDHNRFRGNALRSNRLGILVAESDDNAFLDTAVSNATLWAVEVGSDSTNTTARNLTLGSGATVSFAGEGVALRAARSPPAPPDGRRGVGVYPNVSTADGGWLDLTARYDDADVAGQEASLELWRHGGSWTAVGGSTVDTARNAVSANVSGTGVVAPLSVLPRIAAGNATGRPNGTVTVPVTATAVDVAGYGANLTFDPSVVEVANVTGGAFPNATATVDDAAGWVSISGSRPTGVDAPTLAAVTFRLVGADGATTALSFVEADARLENASGGSIPIESFVGGSVAVRDCDPGDADADGSVASGDATLVLRWVVGLSVPDAFDPDCADADASGSITSGDATLVLRRVVGA